jgi:hypothetical protein
MKLNFTIRRRVPHGIVLAAAFAFCALAPAQAPQKLQQPLQTCSGQTHEEAQIDPEVTWIHVCREAPANPNAAPAVGQPLGAPAGPLSINILEVARHRRNLIIRSRVGVDGETGRLSRVPLTQLASQAIGEGQNVLAAINGDFDMPEPNPGLPSGFAVSNGRLWSAGGPPRPAMAILGWGTPVIGIPDTTMRLHVRDRFMAIDTLNKPMNFSRGRNLRAYTRAFGSEVKASKPFRAIVISNLSPGIPIQIYGGLHGVITEVRNAREVQQIPENALLIAEPPDAQDPKNDFKIFKAGTPAIMSSAILVGGRAEIQEAIGGLPMLVSDGRVSIKGDGEPGAYFNVRQPRTAVCYTPEKTIFAVVDGRQPKLSVGMTMIELADFMASLGCIDAINLDGGSSTEMAVALPSDDTRPSMLPAMPNSGLTIVNSPSDGYERGRPNALLVVRAH